MPSLNNTILLDDRAVVRVTGDDAADFLQNIMSNDIAFAQPLVYSCLLTPQGQFLHDFFIYKNAENDFLLDCDAAHVDDLLRRLKIFKLRAKVNLTPDTGLFVYADPSGTPDPRDPALGGRSYRKQKTDTPPRSEYDDLCISRGIPPRAAIKGEKDILADLNLDLLNAVGWDKGCFIGQEVTARMKYRGLAKKRLMIVAGNIMPPEAGEIRITNSTGTQSLAIIRLMNKDLAKDLLTVPHYLAEVINP